MQKPDGSETGPLDTPEGQDVHRPQGNLMDERDFIVLTPVGLIDSAVAIAACRAGALGVLDLEFATDRMACQRELDRLARFAPHRFGIQLPVDSTDLNGLEAASHLILCGTNRFSSQRWDRTAYPAGVQLYWEATSLEEAVRGLECQVDGLILKGSEAGGRVGSDTSFVLIQKWLQYARRHESRVPFWVRGGIGPNTAAACKSAGARGVVLDSQVLLAREAKTPEDLRRRIQGLDGSETTVVGSRLGEGYRVYARPDSPAVKELGEAAERIEISEGIDKAAQWRRAIGDRLAADPAQGVWLVGQEIGIAARLAESGVTVAGILQGIASQTRARLEAARRLDPLAEGSPLAAAHGTRYPILQGPMTRVSDSPDFAAAVASAGALPFLALALLRKGEVEQLLTETREKVQGLSWGVGILGFVPPEIRSEQLDVVTRQRPPFAIIAGGRPDQARALEAHGIATYLHVPSPGLLGMFLKEGVRRFIFEGQECGGHIGPRSSFALWEAMIAVIQDHLGNRSGDDLHVVFAGGIHDSLSASMVATLSAGFVERGVKVGVLLGTAYLFCREAVETGAITRRFQAEALACNKTVLLETGPGHAIRCIPTPYADDFEREKARLLQEGKPPLEVGIALERMNLGRLRVASKGVDRSSGSEPGKPTQRGLVEVPEEEQLRRGMYMIGDVAALHTEVTTLEELHSAICRTRAGVVELESIQAFPSVPAAPPPCDVAIIGLSCFYPGAGGAWRYWENILDKRTAVIEIPPTHWDWRPFYDPDPRARDKIISKWGGFMDDVLFDPLQYGITPKSIPCIEPLQLLLLEAVRQGIADAGYADRPFARERTAAILGVGGGGMPLSVAYGFRSCMPLLDSIPNVPVKSSDIVELGAGILPEWTEDSFPGILLNVAAGRIANRFDLGGPNMAIDAACGSSLAALYAGVRELNEGTSDVAVVMGADAVQTPFAYVAFSKTHALSPRGRCRPFDAGADGIALAEGIGVAVLKRLADAERDGDRIYAVVKGIGASSDGRDKGLTAPRAEGQLRALRRAYDQARISPGRVGLVEAHGTGTVVGDQTEAQALGQVFREAGGQTQSCALGSVKSMIGHSKCAAGLAGLIKTAFALHHKVLPPTLAEKPNPRANLEGGPLYLNTEPRPWVHGAGHPRTAGVSAFGFGGTNFHTVLEEYTGDYLDRAEAGIRHWPAELLVWRRPDKQALLAALDQCADVLRAGGKPELADLAASVWQSSRDRGGHTAAIVASSLQDLLDKLGIAREILSRPEPRQADPRGIYLAAPEAGPASKVAFLFPGQGSQYPDMLAQAAMVFPEVRDVLDLAERTLAGELERPLGKFIYPPSPFTPEQEQQNRRELQRTEVAQPAVGAASLGMFRLLSSLAIEPDFLAGHSYGEYVALAAAGAMDEAELIRLSCRRGQIIREAAKTASSGMAAVDATPARINDLLSGISDVWVANQNSPHQTVIGGTEAALEQASETLRAAGIKSQRIPVACAFHTPLIASARQPLANALAAISFAPLRKPVFSNTTGTAHTADPAGIAERLAEHLVSPVRFAEEILAMYEQGARVFIEVGPQGVLTGLAGQILEGKPHLAVASDSKSRSGLLQLAHMLGQLLAAGVPVQLDRLYRGRGLKTFPLDKLNADMGKVKPTPTAWVVNGVRSRPFNGPEPRLLGQALPETPPAPARQPAEKPKPPAAKETPAAQAVNGKHPAMKSVRPSAATPPPGISPATSPTVVPAMPRAMTNDMMNDTDLTPQLPRPSSNGHAEPHVAPDGAAQVMLRFQEVMARFLDTQRSVMLGFLGTPDSSHRAASAKPHVNGTGNGNGNGNGKHHLPARAPQPANSSLVNRLASPPAPPRPVPAAAPARSSTPQPAITPVETNGKHLAKAETGLPDKAAATPGAKILDRETLLARLLDLVSERTGYPQEALSIDSDLEADLGIDSIKRVEILGALAESLEAGSNGKAPNLEMEKLSVLKTLRGIADYVSQAIAEPAPQLTTANGTPARTAPAQIAHPGARRGGVQRLVVRLIDAPLPLRPRFAPPAGTIVITDDELGTARELADRLGQLDIDTVLIRMSHGTANPETPYRADLTDPLATAELLDRVRQDRGPIAGFIHLLPLAEARDSESPLDRARREVKSLYLLCRGLENDLRESGQSGSAVLLAATAMGGRMGFGEQLPVDFFAGHGGIAGFIKCLGYEWPEVTVRVVDVDGETPATQLAERLLAELGDADGPFEVGIREDRRMTWQCEPGPLAKDTPRFTLTRADTVLVTGGARGITAQVALELARRFQPRLVLVGSSPLPPEEAPETRNLTTPAEIKAALMKSLQAEGKPSAPASVEAAYRRLVKDREIRANLEAIRTAGSEVDYRCVDVRDREAFGVFIEELSAGCEIKGVIHGAGVIEDKLLRDKTPESFDRVFETKVHSAWTLAERLDPAKLEFFTLFASITSRYGNRGQSDYAAANEVLSKLACDLDRKWPGRVCSIAWGPWARVGMVADLEKHLQARGLELIEPTVGANFAVDELLHGKKGETEVLIAGGTEQAARPARSTALELKQTVK